MNYCQVKAAARNWAPLLSLAASSCFQSLLEPFNGLMLAPQSSVASMSSYRLRYSPVAVSSLTSAVGVPTLAAIRSCCLAGRR